MTRHLGSIEDLSTDELMAILDRAEELRAGAEPRFRPGRVLTLAFFQSSTRTRVGFASAGIRLGFGTCDLWAGRYEPSMSEPESLSDTLRVVSEYSDVIIFRHPHGAAWSTALTAARCPVINGGCGSDEHPTQALIDLYAIRKAKGRLEGLSVGIVGDIRGSRAAHSLMRGLGRFEQAEFRLMGPAQRADPQLGSLWTSAGVARLVVLPYMDLQGLDLLYMTGLPQGTGMEALAPPQRAPFALTAERLRNLPDSGVVLCPLPRVDEIDRLVDTDARVRFLDQSADGLWIRMATLEELGSRSQNAAVPR